MNGIRQSQNSMEPIEWGFASGTTTGGVISENHVPGRIAMSGTMRRYASRLQNADQHTRSKSAVRLGEDASIHNKMEIFTPDEARLVRDALDDRLMDADGNPRPITGDARKAPGEYTVGQIESIIDRLGILRTELINKAPLPPYSYEPRLNDEECQAVLEYEKHASWNRMAPQGNDDYSNTILNNYVRGLGVDEIINRNGVDEVQAETGINLPPGDPFEALTIQDWVDVSRTSGSNERPNEQSSSSSQGLSQ